MPPSTFNGSMLWSLQEAPNCAAQDRVNCEFVLNDQIDSARSPAMARCCSPEIGCAAICEVFYGVNVTDLVTPTPGGSVVRRLGVVAKPGRVASRLHSQRLRRADRGEYLIIAGQSKSGDMKFRGWSILWLFFCGGGGGSDLDGLAAASCERRLLGRLRCGTASAAPGPALGLLLLRATARLLVSSGILLCFCLL